MYPMRLKIYTRPSLLLLCSLILIVNSLSAQTLLNLNQIKKGVQHHLYITPDGKVACSHDESEAAAASLQPQRSIAFNSDASSKMPVTTQISSQSVVSATFSVTYDAGFNTNSSAKAAFQKAVDNWAALITSTQTIRIDAQFKALGTNVLGSAGTNFMYALTDGTFISWYPDALTDAALEMDQKPGQPDIKAQFSNNYPEFYFGTDGMTPANKIDFVSVVMHEIGHGLGFSGSGRTGGTPVLPCTASINSCFGFTATDNNVYPDIYDRSVKNGVSISIVSLSNPSTAVLTFITTNSVFFDSPIVRSVNGNSPAKLYAPSTFNSGSSYSHFDEATFPGGTTNALMSPFIGGGEAYDFPGAIGCALFKEIGWTMAGACAIALPIELSNFQAINQSTRNVLTWTTLTERNNKVFKIERSKDGKNFIEIGEVKGSGTTDFPRSYTYNDETPLSISYYRLRQIDYDGKEKPSKIVSVSLKGDKDFVIFPNPTKDKITFNASDFEPNRVIVYNSLGQIVMDKAYQINELDVSNLPTGVYVIELVSATSLVGDFIKVNKMFVKN
jgi:Secretion system C-terminal sorting domain